MSKAGGVNGGCPTNKCILSLSFTHIYVQTSDTLNACMHAGNINAFNIMLMTIGMRRLDPNGWVSGLLGKVYRSIGMM